MFEVDTMTCSYSKCGNSWRNKEELKKRGMKVSPARRRENVRDQIVMVTSRRVETALFFTCGRGVCKQVGIVGERQGQEMDGKAMMFGLDPKQWDWGDLEVAEVQILNFSLGLRWIRSRIRTLEGNVTIWCCRPHWCLLRRTCTQRLADQDFDVWGKKMPREEIGWRLWKRKCDTSWCPWRGCGEQC